MFGRLGVRRAGSVGAGRLRRRRAARAAAARLEAAASSRCGARSPRASRPTASTTATGWPTRCGASGGSRASPGSSSSISDFRDQHGWERPLGALRARHAVLAVEVADPREGELPAVGRLALVDPETGARIEVDTSRRRVRERFAAARARAPRGAWPRELRRLRVDHVAAVAPRATGCATLGRRLR